MRHILLYLRNVFEYAREYLCIVIIYDYCFIYYTDIYDLVCNVLKYEHIPWVLNVFKSQKIFKAYYGFRVLYVFPFPSAGHWPIGSGRDKVGIRAMVSIADP